MNPGGSHGPKAASAQLERKTLVDLYRTMVRIRKFEAKVTELFMEGHIPGTIHLSTGQEAVAAGAMKSLRQSDRVVLSHRPHGHALAKGMDPKRLFAEILGKANGCCSGKGGSMHIAEVSLGIMPSLPIVGAGIPIAAGMAFASRRLKNKGVAVSVFGDAATNIGAFHEALNLAAIWSLPVVFICENNLYGVSSRITSMTRIERLSDRAKAYGIEGTTIDGNDVTVVFQTVRKAVERARDGGGPSLVECLTYRHGGHSRTDPGLYRPKEEVESWKARDPISRCAGLLRDSFGLSEADIESIDSDEQERIDNAARFAVQCALPDPAIATSDVLA